MKKKTDRAPTGANTPTALSCIGYGIDLSAPPPNRHELSRLRRLWLAYGSGSSVAACAALWPLFHLSPTEMGLGGLALIIASSAAIACAGLAFVMSGAALRRVAPLGSPDMDAVELACQASDEAASYRARVATQERPLTAIEASAMLVAAGYEHQMDSQDIPRLVRVAPAPRAIKG